MPNNLPTKFLANGTWLDSIGSLSVFKILDKNEYQMQYQNHHRKIANFNLDKTAD